MVGIVGVVDWLLPARAVVVEAVGTKGALAFDELAPDDCLKSSAPPSFAFWRASLSWAARSVMSFCSRLGSTMLMSSHAASHLPESTKAFV